MHTLVHAVAAALFVVVAVGVAGVAGIPIAVGGVYVLARRHRRHARRAQARRAHAARVHHDPLL